MPVTPFHFGPGTLLKAIAPRSVSLAAFALSQIAIDVESGYHLVRNEWPVHREVHSFLVTGVVGALTGVAVWSVGRSLDPSGEARIRAEVALSPALVGGLAGGLSHPLLDGIMHSDVRPFWPFSAANPFLGAMGLGALHLLCFAAGVVGLYALALRSAD
jgi:membrane-bound metal-dependent hydrolase YbcI (DUF457 family)